MQLCSKPGGGGHAESNPRPSEEGVSFYHVLRPLDLPWGKPSCRHTTSATKLLSAASSSLLSVQMLPHSPECRISMKPEWMGSQGVPNPPLNRTDPSVVPPWV